MPYMHSTVDLLSYFNPDKGNRHSAPTMFLLTLTLFLCFTFNTQAQYWMQHTGGQTIDEGYSIAIDGNGNTYTTGYFTGTATFGTTTLSSSGSTDIFITKTNAQGSIVWAKKAGGTGSDRGLSIEADAQGNCFITGYFYNTASFGSSSITSSGAQDVFIAKYNTSGVLQWVEKAGGSSADIGQGISIDNSGNVVVTGEFQDTASFGSSSIISGGSSDIFITKLSSAGVFSWTKAGNGVQTNKGLDITCDNTGNIYATGQFSGDITFDVLHNNTMFNAIYVVKYNSIGQEQWFKTIGAGTSNIANGIVSDALGNTYITGDFTGNVTFFGSPNTVLTNTYSERVFVAKYNAAGNLQWATANGSESLITAQDIAIDPTGASYIVGHFECKLDEYADSYGQGTFNSVGFKDVFVTKFNNNGVWQYSRNIGSRSDDYGFGITVDPNGRASITGSFSQELFVPISTNFNGTNLSNWAQYSCTGNSPYCNNSTYGEFAGMTSNGNKDVFIGTCIDSSREPYDYFLRSGTGCSRPVIPACIGPNCPNSIQGCDAVTLDAQTHTCPNIGPSFTFGWGGGIGASNPVSVNTSGTHFITVTSQDGCFEHVDSIDVTIHPLPNNASITDDHGININNPTPDDLHLCSPDSALLTASNFNAISNYWTGPWITLWRCQFYFCLRWRIGTLSVLDYRL